ncbi:MAG: methyltransferase domain-containing protein [Acidobacteriia bacterium]|nr:methyltransferase domain-containing protein [Terriglobia bacterium]
MRVPERLEPLVKPIESFFKWQRAAMLNFRRPVPVYPAAPPAGLKVHVGPAEINLQGWVNVDARAFPHVHVQTSSLALSEFTDGAVSRIYICHVLEHFSFADAEDLLATFYRKLAPGGVLLVSVPDFDAIVRIYTDARRNLDSIKYTLMGGQTYDENFHKSVYNHDSLKALLEAHGYGGVARWTTDEEFGGSINDWSSSDLSLNLKATRR